MAADIRPALTPEEWDFGRELENDHADKGRMRLGASGTGVWIETPGDVLLRGGDLPAIMALANAALPDADPRKITRAEVDALRELASYLEWHDRHGQGALAMDGNDATALAAKLAALLPPI